MHKRKTQRVNAGLQGEFYFEQLPSSPSAYQTQLATLCSYRVDHNSTVLPIWWRRHNG